MAKGQDADDAGDFGAWYETPARNVAHWRFIGAPVFACSCPYLEILDHKTVDTTLKPCKSCVSELKTLNIELTSIPIS